VAENPFADVRSAAVIDQSKREYISVETIEQVLEHCDPTWRVILVLCRYAGLRCPSEVLSLRWEDVDWSRGRFTVTSPKTEHHEGRDSRVIPLFPRLRQELEGFSNRSQLSGYVIERYQKVCRNPKAWRNANLRTQFHKIIRRVGLTPWTRTFHSLRAACETDLMKEFPIHVVSAWLGNTPRIAIKHYLQITQDDFERAANGSGAPAVQNAVQTASATVRRTQTASADSKRSAGFSRPLSSGGGPRPGEKVGVTGFEPATSSSQSWRSSQAELHPASLSVRHGGRAQGSPV
jgi:hypothetical protein